MFKERELKEGDDGNAKLANERGISRRSFFGIMGAVTLATTVPVVTAGCAPTPNTNASAGEAASEAAPAPEAAPSQFSNADLTWATAEGSPYQSIGQANSQFVRAHQDELLEMLRVYPVATEDLTLPDGTIIDKEYVTMYNRFNHMGEGLNGTPGVESFNLLQDMYTLEEARLWNTFPMLEKFSAADWSQTVGMTEAEATEVLDDLAYRRRLDRYVRDEGVVYFAPAYLGGMRIRLYADFTSDVVRNCDVLRGVEQNTTSQYPVYAVVPVGPEVVKEGNELLPNRDWRTIIENHTVFTVQPCGCRSSALLKGEMEEYEDGCMHCFVFGELAEYFLSTDAGYPPLTKEEVLEECDRLMDLGYVPELAFLENPDVLCWCKPERCTMLTAHRNLNGETVSFAHATAYLLDYDQDACIQCNTCVDRCPMHSVSINEEGYPAIDRACVGCGQCALTCPADARTLYLKDEDKIPALPADLTEQFIWQATDRMATNRVIDFVGSELPEYAIEASETANRTRDEAYHFLLESKPTTPVEGCSDGTYTSTHCGIQGPLTLTTTITNGRISDITVGGNKETEGFGSRAIDEIPAAIVAANSLDVDAVSGATHTSVAIFKAVSDCLIEAGAPQA